MKTVNCKVFICKWSAHACLESSGIQLSFLVSGLNFFFLNTNNKYAIAKKYKKDGTRILLKV